MKHLICLLLLFAGLAQAHSQEVWPERVWARARLKDQALDQEKFAKFVELGFRPTKGLSTDALIVVKNGSIIFEQYANGYSATGKHALWSLGKPISNLLLGAAEKRGLMSREDLAMRYYPRFAQLGMRSLKIQHLMRMTSGFKWIEEDLKDIFASDTVGMFYSEIGHRDACRFVSSQPILHPAGEVFNYSSADSLLLMAVLRGVVGEANYRQFPWTALFDPLQMTSITIERDRAGNLLTPYFAWGTAQDMARIGLVFVRGGRWKDQQIVPRDWVQYSTEIAPALLKNGNDSSNAQNGQALGAQLWLNKKLPKEKSLPYPDLPADAFLSYGGRGQMMLMIPSMDLVMVRLATDGEQDGKKRARYKKELISQLVRAFPRGAQ